MCRNPGVKDFPAGVFDNDEHAKDLERGRHGDTKVAGDHGLGVVP
jgi:hypothetical protein